MISPPTDRLHKFLAVAGIGLVLFGVRTGVVAYDESKQKELQFMQSFQPAQDAYAEYAQHVNTAIALHNAWVKAPTEPNRKALDDYLARTEAKEERLLQESRKLDNANTSDLRYSEHSRIMRNVWLAIAAVAISFGSIVCYVGFSQWLRQPEKQR